MTLPSAVASATGIPPSSLAPARSPRVGGPVRLRLAALAWASFVHPLPRLIYNPSDSVAVGWYRVDPQGHGTGSLPRPLSVGSIVLTTLPPDAAALAAQRATCARAAARAWAPSRRRSCAALAASSIDGVPSAAVLPADRWGRCHPGSNAAASNPANCSS